MADGLKKNDPFRKMKSGKSGVRPDFLKNGRRGDRGSLANDLKAAEAGASQGFYNNNASEAKELERGGGFYRPKKSRPGSTRSRGLAGNVANTSKIKTTFKKYGPVMGAFIALFMIGGILAGTQAFQPFSLVAQFQETFNSMHISANERSGRLFKWQMENGRVKNPVYNGGKIFGQKLTISKKQAEELKKQGIEFDEEFEINGKREKVLKYDTGDEVQIITAGAEEMDVSGVDATSGKPYAKKTVGFENFYNSDGSFHQKYTVGSLTWRGQFANWFATITGNYLSKNDLTRSMFADFEAKKEELGGDGMAALKETLKSRIEGGKGGKLGVAKETKEETEGGETETTIKTEEEDLNLKKIQASEVRAKLDNIAGSFGGAANVACAVAGFVGAASALAAAAEAKQIINLTTAVFEAVDKTKAGLGDEAPINETTNALNDKRTYKNWVIEEGGDAQVKLGNLTAVEKEAKDKTAMESAGISALYSGKKVDPEDPSVQSFNLSNNIGKILSNVPGLAGEGEVAGQAVGAVTTAVSAFQACTIAKMGAAGVSLVTSGISAGACVLGLLGAPFSLGTSAVACAPLAEHIGTQVAWKAAKMAVLGGIVSLILPLVTNMLTRDLVSELGGEDLGNALASGGNMYQGGVHRANGGSLSTGDKYREFAVAQQKVVADNARYERESLSPFDITSKNTFMGTLLTNFMSFNTATKSLSGVISAGGSVVSGAMAKIGPGAMAMEISDTLPNMEGYAETCPYLASIGAVGDAYCNPYIMTDVETMGMDPVDIIDRMADPNGDGNMEDSNLEPTGGDDVKIKKDSDLAKYIIYCDNRSSAFGITDYNIANEIGSFGSVNTGVSMLDTAGDSIIGDIPGIGDGVEVIQDSDQLLNVGYISGEACVAGNKSTKLGSKVPEWKMAQLYQRFIEDQSLAESMGLIEESAVSKLVRDYEQEHPIDNSYVGRLARAAGMTKDVAEDTLAVLAYYDEVGKYDPSERYGFFEKEMRVEELEKKNFESEQVLAGERPAEEKIVYRDLSEKCWIV